MLVLETGYHMNHRMGFTSYYAEGALRPFFLDLKLGPYGPLGRSHEAMGPRRRRIGKRVDVETKIDEVDEVWCCVTIFPVYSWWSVDALHFNHGYVGSTTCLVLGFQGHPFTAMQSTSTMISGSV